MEKHFPVKIKHLIWVSFVLLFFLPILSYSQLAKQAVTIQLINKTPVIDGELDQGLSYLDKKMFTHFWHFDNPVTDTVKLSYRLGYTPTHFYVYIETEADSITYRDRGFINGDGFKLLFAIPQTDSGTTEYCELVFSPSKDKKYWARKRIWEYNRKQDHGKKLSNETLFEEKRLNGRCGFEVLIAWKDIEPYHPWFLKEMGYNLYFAKAIGNETANGYAAIADEGIWDEEVPLRKYRLMKFEEPVSITGSVTLARPERRNLKTSQPIIVQTAAIAKEPGKTVLHAAIRKNGSSILFETDIVVGAGKKLQWNSYALPVKQQLLPGRYRLEINSGTKPANSYDITVLPNTDWKSLRLKINNNKNGLPLGVVHTLVFKSYQLQQKFITLKKYESGEEVLSYWENFRQEYDTFLKGIDPYAPITVPYRRAFKSRYDGTYQPYSIKLPKNYDPNRKYPLLVFLHGSGQDEQHLLTEARSDGSFIEVAPYARDMYRCYSSDSSQNDIIEAIDDACKYFSVDRTKIVVGGFSMGGYGALRTYFEHPGLYKGVGVFAGHPRLASDWLGEGHPDFLKDKYLSVFTGVPVFVYHGRKDGALPIQHTESFLVKLKEKGGIVTERLIDAKAHEYPDAETNNLYFQWLNKIVK